MMVVLESAVVAMQRDIRCFKYATVPFAMIRPANAAILLHELLCGCDRYAAQNPVDSVYQRALIFRDAVRVNLISVFEDYSTAIFKEDVFWGSFWELIIVNTHCLALSAGIGRPARRASMHALIDFVKQRNGYD